MSTFKLPVEQVGLERSIQRAMDQFNRKPLKINVDDRSFTQPLGRITGAADEFTKSIEASNARVVAFGASVAVIDSVKNAFSQLVVQTIKVEKALADINVVMGASTKNLDKFGNSLFKIAKNTAQSFDSVATAATEFARQGLSMEETLKRTNDALVLTRLTGMKAADSVKGLTAAINAFGDAGLTTANIMNKLAAVDMAFAVSSEDLIDGLSRASAVAQDAGMNIDQLIGAITAAQQITARGGAVIGNSFKTIFTRIQRPQTIEQLEMLGVAVKDMQGNVIPAIKILENLAKTYDTLSQSQQSNIAQLVGGMFQINTLKAAMRDLGKENSITARAIQISSGATDEAIKKNEQLNKTLDALLTKTGLSLQKLAEQIGSITVGPGIEKILKAVNGLADGISNVLDGDSIGSNFANGFLKGIGNVISGPGAVLILGLVGKLFVDVAKFARTSIANFMGMTSEAQKQKAVQESILNLLRSNHEVVGSLIGQGQTKKQQEQVILDLIVKQTAAQREQLKLAQHLSRVAVNIGANESLIIPERGARRSASGYIPNFNAKQRERNGAIAGGYAPGSVKSMDMPSGQMVIYNTAEKVKKVPGFNDPFINPPQDSRAGKDHRQRTMDLYGFDPYANKGFIPNFAKLSSFNSLDAFSSNFKKTGQKIKLTGAHHYKDKWGYSDLSNEEFKELLESKQGGSLTGDRLSALDQKRAAKQAKTMDIQGSGYASLVPNINLPPSYNTPFSGKFRYGNKDLRFSLSNLLIAGPQSPAGDMVTDPQENALEDAVSQSIYQSSAQFSNAIKPYGSKGVNAPTIKKKMDETPGGKGAIGAAVGAAFEAAVAQAYGIDSAMSAEKNRGDFDVNLSNTKKSPGSMDKVRKLFGIPSSISRMDFKSSASRANLTSMAKKIFHDNKAGYLAQIEKNAAGGFIPNFSKDHPLIEAIQREKDAGLPVSKIRVNQSDRLKSSQNPMGLAVTNTRDEPRGMQDVPNFAKPKFDMSKLGAQKIANVFDKVYDVGKKLNAEMEKFVVQSRKKAMADNGVIKGMNKETVMQKLAEKNISKEQTKEALLQLKFSQDETKEALKQIGAYREAQGRPMESRSGRFGMGPEGRIGSRLERFRTSSSGLAKATKGFGKFAGGIGASFGLPIAGGFVDQTLTSAFGGNRTKMSGTQRVLSGAAGNVTTGLSSGAMLGGAIGSVVPVIGTAVGAAVGGALGAAGGLISSLNDARLSSDELAQVTQDAISVQTELSNTFSQLDSLKASAGGLSDKELNSKLQKILSSVDTSLKNSKGQTFSEAFVGAKNDEERAAVRSEFNIAAQQDVNKSKLAETLSAFEIAQDNTSYTGGFFGRDKIDSGQITKLSSALGTFGLTEDQVGKLSGLKNPTRLGRIRGDGKRQVISNPKDEIKSGDNVASILGFEKGSTQFSDISDIIDDIISEGGWDNFLKAVQDSGKNLSAVLENSAKMAKEMKDAARGFSVLQDNIRKAATKSKIAFEFLKGDLKIKNEIDELRLNYSSVNASVSKRIAMEEEMLKSQVQSKAILDKTENLESARSALLGDILQKLKSEGVTNTGLEKFTQKIQGASEETLTTLLDAPEKLEELLGLKSGSLNTGRALNSSIQDVISGLKERSELIDVGVKIEEQQITAQMRIQELQEKEANARSQLNIAVDEKVRQLRSLQIDDSLGFDSEIRGLERQQKYQAFPEVGRGRQELRDIELNKQILNKRSEKANAEAIRNTQIRATELFKDTSVQDALISANDRVVIALDALRETLLKTNNADVFGAIEEKKKLENDGSSFEAEITKKQSRVSDIKAQVAENFKSLELANKNNASKSRAQQTYNYSEPYPGSGMDDFGSFSSVREEKMKSAFGPTSRNMLTDSSTQGGLVDTAELEKSNASLNAELNSLTKEISTLKQSQALVNSPRAMLFENQGTTNTFQNSKDKAQQFNLGKIFQSAQATIGDPSGRSASEVNQELMQEMLKTITSSNQEFQQQVNDRGLAGKDITEQISALTKDGAFEDIASASNLIQNTFTDLDNSAKQVSHGLQEDAKDLEAHRQQVIESTDPLKILAHETKTAANAIAELKASGNVAGAARASLDLQRQYNTAGPSQQKAMREGMASQGMAPMNNRDVFLAGVASNTDRVQNSELEFYRTLGEDLPRTFSSNMAKALTEAGAGIKSWNDAFQDVALAFLDTLNQAIQNRLSDQILGLVNTGIGSMTGGFSLFSKGGVVRRSNGGEVYGGSGTKDDVPAMLNSGEYVIRKSAVHKYGKDFLTAINQGTVKERNQGGMAGPADPTRKLDEQTGDGGFLISSFGQAGTFEAGAITGRDNLMSFAGQAGTSGARDVISSTGAVDDYGQAMPGSGVNIQLEDESAKLSGLGLISGPVADEVMTAKQQALDAVGAYDRNVEALRKYREQRKKAIKNAIKQALIGAAISFGMSQIQSAVQSTQMAKASNTVAVQGEATKMAIDAGGSAMGPPSPAQVGAFTDSAASKLGFSSGDFYSKGGAFDISKANSRFAMNGISDPGAYIAMTGGAGAGNTRGSTSFTSNLFSRGGNAANRAFAGSGFQVNSMGAVSQRTGFFGGFKGAQLGQSIGGSNTVGGMLGLQSTNWNNSGGTAMMGTSAAPSIASAVGGFSSDTTASSAGFNTGIKNQMSYQKQAMMRNRKAVGGKIIRQSGESEDRVPALLTGGEFVINKDAVKKHGLSFFNSINAQRLNRGGVAGKNVSMPAGSNMDSQSELLQQILDTLIIQGETAESTRSETQTLKETIESKTTNNITTGEAGEAGVDQSTILQSILEEIKNQNTTISQEISNSVQNIIDKRQTSESTEINNDSSSNSSVRNSSNVSNVSNSSNFVEQANIQSDLLSQILLAVQSKPSGGGGGFSTSSGGSGGGVGNININVTVDAKGNSESSYEGGGSSDMGSANGVNSSVDQKADNIAKQIEEAVIKILTDQQRLGGVLQKNNKK